MCDSYSREQRSFVIFIGFGTLRSHNLYTKPNELDNWLDGGMVGCGLYAMSNAQKNDKKKIIHTQKIHNLLGNIYILTVLCLGKMRFNHFTRRSDRCGSINNRLLISSQLTTNLIQLIRCLKNIVSR